MPTIPPRFGALRIFARAALSLAVISTVGGVALGVYQGAAKGDWDARLITGGLGLLALTILIYNLIILTHKAASNSYRTYDALLDVAELLRRQTDYIRTISENSSLSEWAKRIVYREKDYEYLRDTIQGATVHQDWDAVDRLIEELDEQFGLHEEAARLRAEQARARQATTEEKVVAALQRFDSLCAGQKWEQARRESERLKVLFPAEPRIASLPRELDRRRQEYKRRLLKEYEEAVRLHNVDLAHRLLFELDHYLAPNEAAALKETARGVFKAKLQQMGVQFSLAVTDKQFRKAITIGERLVREFPNSRFAQEIISTMPVLRQRAAQEAGHHGS
jgi:hypothetical protein